MRKIVLTTFFIIISFLAFLHFSSAQTIDELNQQISNTNSQIEKLNREIQALSSQIAKTSQEKTTLANAIKDLTLRKDKLIKERQQTEKKIAATGLVIKTLNNEITTKNSILDKSRDSLSNLIKSLYQKDQSTFLEKVLVANTISEFSNEYNNTIELNKKLKQNIEAVSEQKENLTQSKIKKEDEQEVLNTLKQNLKIKEIEIEANKKEKNSLLTETKNKESLYKKQLEETQKRKEAFEKAIEDYEAQIKFILNPKSLPKSGSGVLSWPLNSILVTSDFGKRWGKLHTGLDFRAAVGTNVKAMADGVIEGTGDTDLACKGASFGKWVFIRYNNGLSSTYGHLSVILGQTGQKVKAGDVVALSGNTGSSTGPHLHVSVYASEGVKVATVPSKSCNGKIFTQPISALNAYLDPKLYLPTITPNMVKK